MSGPPLCPSGFNSGKIGGLAIECDAAGFTIKMST
jgi:hypothetical protein